MTRGDAEDPLERLRAADPATRAPAPDHARIRAAVDRRLSETREGTGGAIPDRERARPAATADELAGRRRLRPLRYAAAAVGAVLLLGGGYTLGAGTGGLGARDTAGSGESQAESAGSVAEPVPEIGTAPQAEPGDADGSGQPGAQGTVFTAGDLPAGPAQAQVYALELADGDAEEQAARLAAALDLAGDARDADGTWVIGSEDGSSPVLRLHPDGTLDYADPALLPWRCLPIEPQTEPQTEPHTSAPSDHGQSSAADCSDADVPAPLDAAQTFAAFLTDAGLDADRYEIRTDDSGPGAIVSAALVLGGQESDVHLTGTVVPDGIAAVWGNVATPTELGEYPLISPDEAVQRLMDPRFGPRSGVVALRDPRFSGHSADSSAVVTVPDPRFSGPAPDPGSQVPWPVRQVQITTAELTLVSTVTSTGVLVLPSYELTGTDAGGTEGTWIVPALTEADFDFTG